MTRSEQAAVAVDAARALLAGCHELSPAPADEVAELLVRTAELSRLVEAQQVALAAAVVEQSRGPVDEALCRRLGHRSAKECLAAAFGLRGRQAADLLAMAAATTPTVGFSGATVPARFPRVAAALRDGELSLSQAQAIVQTLEPAAPRADVDDLAWAEAALVEAATDSAAPLGPELIVVQARAYAAVLDPDGVLPDAERQRAMRSLRLGRRRDGMWQLTIVSPPEEGSALKAVLDAHCGPRVPVRFHDPDASADAPDAGDTEAVAGDGQAVTGDGQSFADDRTPEQRRHDVLVGIVRAHAVSGDAPTVGGEAPTLVFTGSIEALDAYLQGVAHRDRVLRIEHTGDLVPIETVDRLLCEVAVQFAVTDEHHHVLQLGRRQRLFSRAQRRALATRDGGCRAPGCSMPPSWCEAHHVLPWLAGGPTDVDNGILLCAYHHHEVHAGRLRIERAGPGPGCWGVVSQLQPVRRRRRAATTPGAARETAIAPGSSAQSIASAAASSLAVALSEPLGSAVTMERRRSAASRRRARVADRPRSTERSIRSGLGSRGRGRPARPRVDCVLRLPPLVLRI
jgi:hypothetical protein